MAVSDSESIVTDTLGVPFDWSVGLPPAQGRETFKLEDGKLDDAHRQVVLNTVWDRANE